MAGAFPEQESTLLRSLMATDVWKSAKPEQQTEMMKRASPVFSSLPKNDQEALRAASSQKFIPVRQPTVARAAELTNQPQTPHLGPFRTPDIYAGTREIGGARFRPVPYQPVRDIAKGTGSLLGGVVGSAGTAYTGPGSMAGAGSGAAIGAALAGQAAEGGAYIGRRTPIVRDLVDFGDPRGAMESAREMTTDMVWEMAALGAGSLVKPATRPLKGIIKRSLSKGEAGIKAMEQGERLDQFGIPVGFQEVSDSFLARYTQPLMGQLPGFIGPFRNAFRRRATDQGRAVLRFMDNVGPRTLTEPEISKLTSKSAKARLDHVYTVLDSSFNGLYDRMQSSGLQVNPSAAKSAATSYLKTIKSEAIPQVTKKQIDTGLLGAAGEKITRMVDETARVPRVTPGTKFAERVLKLPDNIGVKEYRGLLTEIDVAIEHAKKSGYDTKSLIRIKGDLINGLGDSLSGDPKAVASFKRQYDSLRAIWGQAKDLAEGPLAAKIPGRLAFRGGDGKNVAEDMLFDASIKDFSPDSMVDLRRLVGKDTYKQIVSRRIEETINKASLVSKESKRSATEAVATSEPVKLHKLFGLDDTKGLTFQAWQSSLKPLGVEMRDIRRLVEALEVANRHAEPMASQLAKRRVALSGSRAMLTSIIPTAGIAAAGGGTLAGGPIGGAVIPLASYLTIRRWGSLITNPDVLREITREIREETAVAVGAASRQAIDRARASAARKLLAGQAISMIGKATSAGIEGVASDIGLVPERTVRVQENAR